MFATPYFIKYLHNYIHSIEKSARRSENSAVLVEFSERLADFSPHRSPLPYPTPHAISIGLHGHESNIYPHKESEKKKYPYLCAL